MKNPYFTFLTPDNFYATPEDDIDPQLLTESLKSFRSEAKDAAKAMKQQQKQNAKR